MPGAGRRRRCHSPDGTAPAPRPAAPPSSRPPSPGTPPGPRPARTPCPARTHPQVSDRTRSKQGRLDSRSSEKADKSAGKIGQGSHEKEGENLKARTRRSCSAVHGSVPCIAVSASTRHHTPLVWTGLLSERGARGPNPRPQPPRGNGAERRRSTARVAERHSYAHAPSKTAETVTRN